jgi:hypothetical protein
MLPSFALPGTVGLRERALPELAHCKKNLALHKCILEPIVLYSFGALEKTTSYCTRPMD